MHGISPRAAGGLENRKKFNGIEHTTDLELNQYDAFYRNLDPQVGRFWQIDPKPNQSLSLYGSMDNNPIRYNDILGDSARPPKVIPLPIHQKTMPNIYQHISNAIAKGKPVLLTYDSDKKNRGQRRYAALKGHVPAKPGKSLDEYPFASTMQGGKGASVKEVPATEQSLQGSVIGTAVTTNKMQTGDQFLVTPIPDNGPTLEPSLKPVVSPKPSFWDYVNVVVKTIGILSDPKNTLKHIPAPPAPCGCPN